MITQLAAMHAEMAMNIQSPTQVQQLMHPQHEAVFVQHVSSPSSLLAYA